MVRQRDRENSELQGLTISMDYLSGLSRRYWALICAMLWTAACIGGAGAAAFGPELQNVRIKPQWDKTEVVLDLNNPAQNVQVKPLGNNQVAITFPGEVAQSLSQTDTPVAGQSGLKRVSWQKAGDSVRVVLVGQTASAAVKVLPLEAPNRLLITVEEPAGKLQQATLSPGVKYQHKILTSPRGPLNVNIIEADPANPQVAIEPVLASSTLLHGTARVSQMVQASGSLAGVNASFFKPDSGTVLGTTIVNKELLSGPIYERVCFGIAQDSSLHIARIRLNGQVVGNAGFQIPIHNVNQPRLTKQEYIMYSPRWGKLAPNTPKEGLQIQVTDNVITAVSTERQAIPENGYVILGPQFPMGETPLVGMPVSATLSTTPDWSGMTHAVSGGPYLLKNGQIYVDAPSQSFKPGGFYSPAPRTAIGITKTNRLLLVTVDGRQSKSVGVTLSEMAGIMKSLGAVDAMNLDGGSSTQMVVNGRVVNSPTVAGGARVSSALVIRQVPPVLPTEVIGNNLAPLVPEQVPSQ